MSEPKKLVTGFQLFVGAFQVAVVAVFASLLGGIAGMNSGNPFIGPYVFFAFQAGLILIAGGAVSAVLVIIRYCVREKTSMHWSLRVLVGFMILSLLGWSFWVLCAFNLALKAV